MVSKILNYLTRDGGGLKGLRNLMFLSDLERIQPQKNRVPPYPLISQDLIDRIFGRS